MIKKKNKETITSNCKYTTRLLLQVWSVQCRLCRLHELTPTSLDRNIHVGTKTINNRQPRKRCRSTERIQSLRKISIFSNKCQSKLDWLIFIRKHNWTNRVTRSARNYLLLNYFTPFYIVSITSAFSLSFILYHSRRIYLVLFGSK